MRAKSREGRRPALSSPEETAPPLLYVVSRKADNANGYRFEANLLDLSLPPAEAAVCAGRHAGFEMHPQSGSGTRWLLVEETGSAEAGVQGLLGEGRESRVGVEEILGAPAGHRIDLWSQLHRLGHRGPRCVEIALER